MGHTEKTSKGEISITNCRGRIRLRWRYLGERYSLSLDYSYSPTNLHYAALKADEIKLDIRKGCFDTTLEKYKPPKPVKPAPLIKAVAKEEPKPVFLNDLIEKFNYWGNHIRNIDVENSIDYLYTRKLLEKWVNIPIDQIAIKLNFENWANSTYNRRLNYLKTFFAWLQSTGYISQNYLMDVRRKRDKKKKKNPRRMPISEEEISLFLTAINSNIYCPATSRFKHSYYYPFLLFIFSTGVRNAEAIGLKVKHLDFENLTIEISEALARTMKGTNHAARIEKGTKMENVRYLPMTEDLKELLALQIIGKSPDDLVFLSPRGLSIDDRMLERRIIKPVLIKLDIGDRDLYVARHSFGTRAVQQGMPLTDVAYLMGHTTIETASRNYVDVGKPAVSLPNISLKLKK